MPSLQPPTCGWDMPELTVMVYAGRLEYRPTMFFCFMPKFPPLVTNMRQISNHQYIFCKRKADRWRLTPRHLSFTYFTWVTDSTFTFDIQRVTLETCDLWDIWSECWGYMTWLKQTYLPTLENTLKERSWTLATIETFDQQWWSEN